MKKVSAVSGLMIYLFLSTASPLHGKSTGACVDNITGVVRLLLSGDCGAGESSFYLNTDADQGSTDEQVKAKKAKGSQGAKNSQGTQGTQVVKGSHGPHDPQGTHDSQGSKGPHDPQGTHDSQGSKGAHDPQGTHDSQGSKGAQGTQGIQGAQGTQGPPGPRGPQGPQGPTGAQGPQGLQGPPGFNIHVFDANGQFLGLCVGLDFDNTFKIFIPSLSKFAVLGIDGSSAHLQQTLTTDTLYYKSSDCTGQAYVAAGANDLSLYFIQPLQGISSGKFLTLKGPAVYSSAAYKSIETNGQCIEAPPYSGNFWQASEVQLPFSSPVPGPLQFE